MLLQGAHLPILEASFCRQLVLCLKVLDQCTECLHPVVFRLLHRQVIFQVLHQVRLFDFEYLLPLQD